MPQMTLNTNASALTVFRQQLDIYADLKRKRDRLDDDMKTQRDGVRDLLVTHECDSLSHEGYTATIVSPTKKTLDPKILITLGVNPDLIEQATVTTPMTPYLKITVPSDKRE